MAAEDLEAFALRLADDVEQGRHSDGGETYSEREFTRQILERLGEDGIVEDPVFVREGEVRFQRRSCRITGFALSEDQDRLLLITTVFTGEVPPRVLSRDEKMTAVKQALNFYECSSRGLHEHIEPSNTDASDLARRIYESGSEIATLRMILLSDAVTGLDSIDLRNPSGPRVVVDLYGIERLRCAGVDSVFVDHDFSPQGSRMVSGTTAMLLPVMSPGALMIVPSTTTDWTRPPSVQGPVTWLVASCLVPAFGGVGRG